MTTITKRVVDIGRAGDNPDLVQLCTGGVLEFWDVEAYWNRASAWNIVSTDERPESTRGTYQLRKDPKCVLSLQWRESDGRKWHSMPYVVHRARAKLGWNAIPLGEIRWFWLEEL